MSHSCLNLLQNLCHIWNVHDIIHAVALGGWSKNLMLLFAWIILNIELKMTTKGFLENNSNITKSDTFSGLRDSGISKMPPAKAVT